MIEINLIFFRGWQSLDSNSVYPATRGLSTGGWREHVGVPVKADSHIACRAHAVPLPCHAVPLRV
jgi:hypothetical protein